MSAAGLAWICAELVGLWIGLPLYLWRRAAKPVSVMAVLLAACVYAVVIVAWERPSGAARGFRGGPAFTASLIDGVPWVGAAVPVLMLLVVALHGSRALWQWPVLGSGPMIKLLLFYAAVSVTSQEFLFSSFFFWRYRALFSTGVLVALNTAAFGLAHIVYGSWISVTLSLLSRVALVAVYQQHQSFWGVAALHALFGLAAFLIGLGRYFYRAPASPR
jgi:hypothetical protein